MRPKHQRVNLQRNGFTLVELLVVVGIIAILAGLLLPWLARTNEKGRQISCFSNVRQHTLAIVLYADDQDDTLPPVAWAFDNDERNWTELVQPYLPAKAIHLCPSDKQSSQISYGLNEFGFVDLEDDPHTLPKQMSAFHHIARTLAVGELGVEDDFATPRVNTLKMVAPSALLDDDKDARPVGRHSSRCNLGFLDGHAEALSLVKFYVRQTPADRWFTGW